MNKNDLIPYTLMFIIISTNKGENLAHYFIISICNLLNKDVNVNVNNGEREREKEIP